MTEFNWQEADQVQLISPQQLQQWCRQADAPLMIDLREPEAHQQDAVLFAQLPQARVSNIPISELGSKLNEMDPDQPLVMLCQVGQKSFHAASLLLEADFAAVYSLHGGISALKRELVG